jgi:hypothetical protein
MAADVAIAAQNVSHRCLDIIGIDYSSNTQYGSVIHHLNEKLGPSLNGTRIKTFN